METLLRLLVPIAMIAVVIVLLFGLFNLMRGGSPHRSQKLMQMRVLLQFVAVALMMAVLYFTTR